MGDGYWLAVTIYNSPQKSGHCPNQSSSSTSDSGNNYFFNFFSVWILHCRRSLKLENKKVGLFCYKSWSNFMQLVVMGALHISKNLIRRRYPHILSHVMYLSYVSRKTLKTQNSLERLLQYLYYNIVISVTEFRKYFPPCYVSA